MSLKIFSDSVPPVGAYDPKHLDKAQGGLIDSKTDRFKDSKGKF